MNQIVFHFNPTTLKIFHPALTNFQKFAPSIKVIGRRPQGTLLGFYGASGTAARVMFPIVSGYIVAYSDVENVFRILVLVLTLSLILVLTFRKTLKDLSQ